MVSSNPGRDELATWLRLAASPGVGALTMRRLLAAFGSPQAIQAQPLQVLQQLVSPAQARAVLALPPGIDDLVERTWRWLNEPAPGTRRHIATLGDPLYPPALLQIEDPPPLLYLLGQVDELPRLDGRALAMVGSRNPTPQGAAHATAFAQALVQAGLTIVSGLALGIDGAAHAGALDGSADHPLVTVAVVGTGLDRVYPSRHRELAHRIARQGVLMSELPLGTPPLSPNFPRRNRIISGLSQGTLVVEAALASGSLITARLAVEQNREVFAIPGSVHSPQSRGCHALIRQGAKLVETAQDVLEELQMPSTTDSGTQQQPDTASLEPPEPGSLLACLGHDPVSLDALAARTGLDTATLQARLLDLELDGQLARLPGGLFQRLVRA